METPTADDESTAARPPPLIIRIPPPERLPFQGWTLVLVLAPIIVAGIVMGLYIMAQPERAARLIAPLVLWSCALFLVLYGAIYNRRYRNRRAALCWREIDASRAAEPLLWTSLWRSPYFPPTLDKLIDAAFRSEALSSRAVILCVGFIDPPTGGDFRFEPEIIPTTQFLWKRAYPLPFALLLLAVWALQRTGLLPGRLSLGALAYPAVFLLTLGAVLLWKGAVRPSYIRLAPGMVQIMRYGMRSKKPEVRSYAMEAGTIVIVSDASGRLNLHLACGQVRDTIPLAEMRKPREQLERIWPALLSNAPTPPLSDEELLG